MSDVLLKGNRTSLCQRNASSGLAFQVGNGDGHVAALLLKPLDLFNHHRVAKVHLTAGHQPREDAERLTRSLSFQNVVDVTVGEHDAATVKFGG